jgi:hypothetical protein
MVFRQTKSLNGKVKIGKPRCLWIEGLLAAACARLVQAAASCAPWASKWLRASQKVVPAEFRMRVETGADCRAVDRQIPEVGKRRLHAACCIYRLRVLAGICVHLRGSAVSSASTQHRFKSKVKGLRTHYTGKTPLFPVPDQKSRLLTPPS